MLKKTLIVVGVLIAAIWLGITVREYAERPTPANTTASTQAFFAASMPDANNQQQAMSQWQGKILIVNFWATWCPPCREEMPELSQLHTQYQSQDVVVLGIAAETSSKIQEFSQSMPITYPLLAADMQAMVLSESLGNNNSVLPYTVVIDRAGNIIEAHVGRINKALIEQNLLTLLASASQ